MDRELLLEVGCEELPASWLPGLTQQIGDVMNARLGAARIAVNSPIETYSTPRRLMVRIAQLADRQTDAEETVTGPPSSAAFDGEGRPTPAATGFARKHGVEVAELSRVQTPKGEYLAFQKRARGRPSAEVLSGILALALRDLTFPKLMRWDAWLDDGRGELLFGRPIRWILYLYGGRVVPFEIRRTETARAATVQDVRSGAVTYGHRLLASSGRPGRALKARTFADYLARLSEHFVILDRTERRDLITRALDAQASRSGGRIWSAADGQALLLQEVPDLVEYPSVVAGTFPPEFLDLPDEVLTTTMIHHQHFFPVVNEAGRLLPAFLAVINTQPESTGLIARNAERVLTARLRDARFFWDADCRTPLADRLERLETLLFHKALGSYRAKADRIERLAAWIARDVLGRADLAQAAGEAARLAKTDLTTEMVGELPELQGVMGGIYARVEGYSPDVWVAIYHHYLPVAIEPDASPSAAALGDAAPSWAAVALADKLDTIAGLFSAGEEPTGSRDPFGLRRLAQGIVRILVDAPRLLGLEPAVDLDALLDEAWRVSAMAGVPAERRQACAAFLRGRVRHVLRERGARHDEVAAALGARGPLAPLGAWRRAEALASLRGSEDFQALAVLFKRVKNIAREIGAEPVDPARLDRHALGEPAERELLEAFETGASSIREALAAGDFRAALLAASAMRPAVDRFFTEVFVMVEDERLRRARLVLLALLRDLVLDIADISEIGGEEGESE